MDETYLNRMALWEKSCILGIEAHKQTIRSLESDIELNKSLIELQKKIIDLETSNLNRGIAEKEEYIKREGLA